MMGTVLNGWILKNRELARVDTLIELLFSLLEHCGVEFVPLLFRTFNLIELDTFVVLRRQVFL